MPITTIKYTPSVLFDESAGQRNINTVLSGCHGNVFITEVYDGVVTACGYHS